MSISLSARFWKFLLKRLFKGRRLTVAEHRKDGERFGGFPKLSNGMKSQTIEVDGIRAEWLEPPQAGNERALLHLHGGGYVTGGISSHRMLCIPMAQTLGMRLLLPEYRLAPEHPFPAALEDAVKIYRWLLAQGYDAKDIFISGDSAGGGLALATVLKLQAENEPLPSAVICLSPWADLTNQLPSRAAKEKAEAVLRNDVLREWALCYAREDQLKNPLVSPIFADFNNFPPLFIQAGGDEILLDDSVLLAEKARAAGVPVTLQVWDGMWHVWHALGDLIPESRLAFNEIREFIREL